jgi:hypothetical protein
MAYQLQPGMNLVENPARPPVCANEEVFVYPALLITVRVALTRCCTGQLLTWLVRAPPLNTLRPVIS